MMPARHLIRSDAGFTILEVIVVMVLVAILAGIFSETINSSMMIYSDQTLRKDLHIDARRSFDFLSHSIREWTDWETSPSSTLLDFHRYSRFQDNNNNIYYDFLREAYSVSNGGLNYQRDDGTWDNLYPLISSGISPSTPLFSTTTLGGKQRIIVNLSVVYNNKPLRMAVTVFPRQSGG